MSLVPETVEGVKALYGIVVIGGLIVNIIWDIVDPNTPKLTTKRIRDKASLIFALATLASSLLLIMSVFNKNLATTLGDFWIPVLLCGMVGVLMSFPELVPKKEAVTDPKPELSPPQKASTTKTASS